MFQVRELPAKGDGLLVIAADPRPPRPSTLIDNLKQFDEARAFLRDRIPEAMRVCGKDHDITFKMQRMYAQCLFQNDGASRSDLTEAVAKLEDLDRRQTRIFGASHPQTDSSRRCLQVAREKLARA